MIPSAQPDALIGQLRPLMAARRFGEARALLGRIAELPAHAAWAHERIAHTFVQEGRFPEALAHVREALARPVPSGEVAAALASVCLDLGLMREAGELCRHPRVAASDNVMVHSSVGHSAMAASDYETAVARYERALALGNPRANIRAGLGIAHTFLGNLDLADAHLEASLALQPYNSHTHWNLAKLRRQTPERNHVERLRQRLATPGLDDNEIAHLGYALFKELDDLRRTDEAWAAWQQGSQAMRRAVRYDRAAERAVFQALLDMPCAPAAAAASVPPGPQPIFILGLPRSGTTLVDRIVSGHSQVTSAGELNDFLMRLRWQARQPGRMTPDLPLIAAAGALDLPAIGRDYLERTAWRAAGRPFYTDKLPHNFMNIGWIRAALPQARIVHLVRNPMDVCWSNLKELFVGGYFYSNDLDDLAEHYHGYRQLMAHWHAAFPGAILDVDYDALVADPEPWARRILDFLGLPFEPQCLRIEDNAAPVATASATQVREGIHRRASGQWQRYEAQLQPLRARLQAYGYLGADGAPATA